MSNASAVAAPRFSIVLPVHDPALGDLERAIASCERQPWPFIEICIADDASRDPTVRGYLDDLAKREDVRLVRLEANRGIAGATNAALELATGDFSIFLDHDDELADDAVPELVRALARHPEADFLYSDHDVVDTEGQRLQVQHKPGWSPHLLLSYMYVSHIKVVRTQLAKELGGFRSGFEGSADYDFVLRVAEATDRIHHIPRVLYHWRAAEGSMALRSDSKTHAFEAGRRAVDEAAQRRGIAAEAVWPEWAQRARVGVYRLRYRETADVPVTIVIPTRDHVELLRDCIDSIESQTEHRNFSILIVDNGSADPEALSYLESTPHRVLRDPAPFNFSRLVNRGVEASETELVVLLNNDILVSSPEWLDELIGVSQVAGVGAVGGKLLFANGQIQHAGVTLGIHGLAGHCFQGSPDRYSPLEYGMFAHVARDCAAVTAACMLVKRSLYREVGGFDQDALAVAFNDVDFCLRLAERGYRSVMNPYAELIHLESQSRGDAKNDREVALMYQRWPAWIERDPYYNPNLSKLDTEFTPRTMLDERPFFDYSPKGFRAARPPLRAISERDLEALDLQALGRAQETRIQQLTARVAQLETSGRLATWLAARPLMHRLASSRTARSALRRLRRLRRFPLLEKGFRRLGLIS